MLSGAAVSIPYYFLEVRMGYRLDISHKGVKLDACGLTTNFITDVLVFRAHLSPHCSVESRVLK